MSFNIVRRGLLLGGTLSALALVGSASAATLHGVVVQHNPRAHSFVVALTHGKLASIHSHKRPTIGRVVVVSVRQLRNGTFAAKHVKRTNHIRGRVRFRGVVTFVNRRRGMFTVSANGASLLVRTHHRALGAAAQSLPSVGEQVQVEAQVDDQGDLEDQGVQDQGDQNNNVDVEGTILNVDTTNSQLTISADDDGESGQSIVVDVPSTIDITQFSSGQEVELTVSIQPDGSFVLVGSSEDGDSSEANNPGDQQGCQGDGQDSSCSSSTGGSDGADNSGDGNSDPSGSGSSGSGSTPGDDNSLD
jgi:hypothetical protein